MGFLDRAAAEQSVIQAEALPESPRGVWANLFQIDFSGAVEAACESSAAPAPSDSRPVLETMFFAAYRICRNLAAPPNVCVPSAKLNWRGRRVKIVLFSAREIGADVLELQVREAFAPLFPQKALDMVGVYSLGTTHSRAAIRAFLQTED